MKVFILPGFLVPAYAYKSLAEELKKSGHDVKIFDLKEKVPLFKKIDEYAKRVIQDLEKETDEFVVIAHSFSGIILKGLIKTKPFLKEKIAGIVFVAAPHDGTWMALMLGILPAMRALLPAAKTIQDTKDVILPGKVINFMADSEIKIQPKHSGELKGFTNVVISGANHDNIIRNKKFIDKTVEFINSL